MIPKDGSFGKHFAGQFILPDNNSQSLCRIMIEKVDGVHQGMATYLLNGSGLRSGNNRHVFSPDGSAAEDKRTHQITKIESNGKQSVTISLSGFEPGRLYELKLPEVKDSEETKIHNQLFYYTAHKIPGN
jgi:hypothetical protein